MARYVVYVVSLACAVLAVGFLFLAKFAAFDNYRDTHPYEYASFQVQLDLITLSIIAIACAFTALSMWGMVGVALSKAREKKEEFAQRAVITSRKSWHYRLNTRLNLAEEPPERCSECEYWARFFNGLFAVQVVALILGIIIAVILALGWLNGSRPILDAAPWRKNWYDAHFFEGERQWMGPVTLGLLLLGGLVAGLVISGAGHAAGQNMQNANWTDVGKWSGIVVAAIIAGVASVFILAICGRWVFRTVFAPFFSFLAARAIGVCRPIQFVD